MHGADMRHHCRAVCERVLSRSIYLFIAYQIKYFFEHTYACRVKIKIMFLWCKRPGAEHTDVLWDHWKQRVIILQLHCKPVDFPHSAVYTPFHSSFPCSPFRIYQHPMIMQLRRFGLMCGRVKPSFHPSIWMETGL